jgi:hypothetical protein
MEINATVFMPAHYTGSVARSGLKWHYTTGTCFLQITEEGYIQPATAYIAPGERPIVWFSTNPIWEPTACKGVPVPGGLSRTGTFEETYERGRGLVRFGVAASTAPHAFRALVSKAVCPASMRRAWSRRLGRWAPILRSGGGLSVLLDGPNGVP